MYLNILLETLIKLFLADILFLVNLCINPENWDFDCGVLQQQNIYLLISNSVFNSLNLPEAC